uniref:BAG domain-containing protein n=1 Tax=Pyramimonas obovata TaxID=1411642 RepID=A0A7S0RS13_9CHLO
MHHTANPFDTRPATNPFSVGAQQQPNPPSPLYPERSPLHHTYGAHSGGLGHTTAGYQSPYASSRSGIYSSPYQTQTVPSGYPQTVATDFNPRANTGRTGTGLGTAYDQRGVGGTWTGSPSASNLYQGSGQHAYTSYGSRANYPSYSAYTQPYSHHPPPSQHQPYAHQHPSRPLTTEDDFNPRQTASSNGSSEFNPRSSAPVRDTRRSPAGVRAASYAYPPTSSASDKACSTTQPVHFQAQPRESDNQNPHMSGNDAQQHQPQQPNGTTGSNPGTSTTVKLERRFSTKSSNALTLLKGYEEKLQGIIGQLEDTETALKEGRLIGRETLGKAKTAMGQLNGTLEKLQLQGVDGVTVGDLETGRDEARAYRKQLNTRIEATVPRIIELNNELVEQMKACSITPTSVAEEQQTNPAAKEQTLPDVELKAKEEGTPKGEL